MNPTRFVILPALCAFVLPVATAMAASPERVVPVIQTSSITTFVYPIMGPRLSSDYGKRKHPVRKVSQHHHGIDLAAPKDAPIRSIADGVVMYADPFGGYGKLIVIQHSNGLTSHYGHCSRITVQPGRRVRAGDIIGSVGSTGISTGPHLHFELRKSGVPVNPEKILPGLAEVAQG
jgi:murein DD-endopeptidase MepM/ murein hydrolase activator NlpD